jgi:hypothetical protein
MVAGTVSQVRTYWCQNHAALEVNKIIARLRFNSLPKFETLYTWLELIPTITPAQFRDIARNTFRPYRRELRLPLLKLLAAASYRTDSHWEWWISPHFVLYPNRWEDGLALAQWCAREPAFRGPMVIHFLDDLMCMISMRPELVHSWFEIPHVIGKRDLASLEAGTIPPGVIDFLLRYGYLPPTKLLLITEENVHQYDAKDRILKRAHELTVVSGHTVRYNEEFQDTPTMLLAYPKCIWSVNKYCKDLDSWNGPHACTATVQNRALRTLVGTSMSCWWDWARKAEDVGVWRFAHVAAILPAELVERVLICLMIVNLRVCFRGNTKLRSHFAAYYCRMLH